MWVQLSPRSSLLVTGRSCRKLQMFLKEQQVSLHNQPMFTCSQIIDSG